MRGSCAATCSRNDRLKNELMNDLLLFYSRFENFPDFYLFIMHANVGNEIDAMISNTSIYCKI